MLGFPLRRLVVVVLLLSSAPAWAQADPKQECLAAFSEAQELRSSGSWVQARKQLIVCAAATCPSVTTSKCNEWLEQLDVQLPTIVLSVRAASGDVAEAQVRIDGVVVAERIDGKPTPIDPGERTIEVRANGQTMTQKLVVTAGEKARRVSFELNAAEDPPPPVKQPVEQPVVDPQPDATSDSGLSPLVWVGYGVGLAGIVVGAITGSMSLAKASDISDRCPDDACPPDVQADIDSGTLLAHVSTACFAIGAAGIALGTVGLLLGGDDEAVAVLVQPGHIALRGSF